MCIHYLTKTKINHQQFLFVLLAGLWPLNEQKVPYQVIEGQIPRMSVSEINEWNVQSLNRHQYVSVICWYCLSCYNFICICLFPPISDLDWFLADDLWQCQGGRLRNNWQWLFVSKFKMSACPIVVVLFQIKSWDRKLLENDLKTPV